MLLYGTPADALPHETAVMAVVPKMKAAAFAALFMESLLPDSRPRRKTGDLFIGDQVAAVPRREVLNPNLNVAFGADVAGVNKIVSVPPFLDAA
jgi:hypothetical protein